MSSKPESRFITSVHRHLSPQIYREKMYNPLRGGTWDCWYSGKQDMWIEYKWIERIPVRDTTLVVPELSELQKLWGRGRYKEGRRLAVIVGCPEGGVTFHNLDWEEPISAAVFRANLVANKDLAAWIVSIVGVP